MQSARTSTPRTRMDGRRCTLLYGTVTLRWRRSCLQRARTSTARGQGLRRGTREAVVYWLGVWNDVAYNARPARRRVVARPRKESALSHSCSLPRQLPCAPGVAALPEGQLLQKGAEIGLGDESERRGVLDLDLRPRKARSNINCWLPRQAAAVTKKVKKIGDSSNSPPQSAAVVHHLSHLRQHAV